MAMTFAERMKARQAELAASGKATTPLSTTPPEPTTQKEEPKQVAQGFRRFGQPKPQAESTASLPTEERKEEKKEEKIEQQPLPKVIQSFNVLNKEKPTTLGESLSGMAPEDAVKIIQQRIQDMSTLEDGTQIRYEMEKLSTMLLENPSACLYLLDEDLGLAVRALRKMTDNRVAIDMGKAKAPKKGSSAAALSRPLSVDEIKDALDAL